MILIASLGAPAISAAAMPGACDATLAYVGPGAGLGAVGALLAVVGAILIGLFGLVLYPLHLLRSWLRGKADPAREAASDAASSL
jgi:hypothetical protein